MPSGQGVASRKYRVEVEERLCKSCGICIAFCTRGVLEAQGALRKAVAAHPERCTGCRMCEIYCPDWAISVEPATPEADAADAAADTPAGFEVVTRRPGGGERR